MNADRKIFGHLIAFFTVFIWATTFISTKILLRDFSPVEILFFRFVMGLLMLTIVFPHRLSGMTKKQELLMASAGLCGVTLYFLLENIALTYSLASNIAVIVSVAPFFTAIFASLFLDGEKPGMNFFIGFITAMAGICLISFSGGAHFSLHLIGDVLALLAAIVWALYSVLVRKISAWGCNIIQTTRRVFLYGILLMLPALPISGFRLGLARFQNPVYLFNIFFLGLGASALCFVTWSMAVKLLGAVKTSVYIYAVPVITVFTSMLVLNEKITVQAAAGTALALFGLLISEHKNKKPIDVKAENST